jgi:hypothetical protein
MREDTRSLWEQYHSEAEPWRRGRAVLVAVGSFYLLLQTVTLSALLLLGNLEASLASAAFCAVFWLLFYLIWIGVNWIRWVAGAWSGLTGFAYLIWAVRDNNALQAVFGSIHFLIGTYFCLSPSVYFFAKRQREKRSWLHSGMIAGVFVLLCVTFLIGAVGLVGYRAHVRAAAIDFVQEAAQRIYGDQDRDWLVRHSTREALANSERAGVLTVFDEAARFMGPVRKISAASGEARVFYRFPATFVSDADMVADGESAYGHACLYFAIVDLGSGWQVHWTWWEHPGTPTGVCKSVHPLQPRTLSAR